MTGADMRADRVRSGLSGFRSWPERPHNVMTAMRRTSQGRAGRKRIPAEEVTGAKAVLHIK